METMELLQYLRFREVQKILDELLRQRLIDPVMYDMVLRKYQRICSHHHRLFSEHLLGHHGSLFSDGSRSFLERIDAHRWELGSG